VHIVILIGKGIVITRGPHVPLLIDIQFQLISKQGPNPQVKLPPQVKKRFLHVFLDHPKAVPRRSGEDKLLDVSDVSKYLDPSSLVQSCRFHEPDVFLTVLVGNSLFLASSLVDLFESGNELLDFMIILIAGN
jgi:hypothetical protein